MMLNFTLESLGAYLTQKTVRGWTVTGPTNNVLVVVTTDCQFVCFEQKVVYHISEEKDLAEATAAVTGAPVGWSWFRNGGKGVPVAPKPRLKQPLDVEYGAPYGLDPWLVLRVIWPSRKSVLIRDDAMAVEISTAALEAAEKCWDANQALLDELDKISRKQRPYYQRAFASYRFKVK